MWHEWNSRLNGWTKSGRERGKKRREKEKEGEREEEKRREKLHLVFAILGDRTVSCHRSKRQSSSTGKELHLGARIRGFRQTSRR